MYTRTIEEKVYTFEDLKENDELREKVLENLFDINVDHEWWDYYHDYALTCGFTIHSFDTGRGNQIEISLDDDVSTICAKIMEESGETYVLHKLAKRYVDELSELEKKYIEDDEYNEEEDTWYDDEYSEFADEFKLELGEEMLSLLRKEYEYLTSEEAILETIESNGYEFNELGEIT